MSRELRVTEDGVRLRAAPDTSSEVLGTYPAGTLAEAVTEHGWRQVRVPDQIGWMAAEFLEPGEIRGDSPQNDPSSEAPKQEDPPSGLHFDPNTPTELQHQDWTCSIRSTMWLLKSIGIDVTPEEAQDAMAPQYVNSDVGLLDGSGAGIVAVLRDRWGVSAYNDWQADFDAVAAVAGKYPVALGLHNWGMPGGHWSAVRGFDQNANMLILANPAGTGPRFGQQTLSREQFDARLGASMVVVLV